MIGKTVSHYKILEKLGGGGMGIVYKAQDLKLDRFVALKFLPPYLSTSEEEKQRFIHEAKAASTLDHSNICTIFEIGETKEGKLFIAMAYYDGETLKEKISKGPLPLKEVVDPLYISWIYLGLNDWENTSCYLDQAYQGLSSYLPIIKVDSFYDTLRGDARFIELLQKMGLEN